MALNQEGRVDGAKTVTLSVECMYYDYFGETLICFSLPVDRGFQCIAIHIFFFWNSVHNIISHLDWDHKNKLI